MNIKIAEKRAQDLLERHGVEQAPVDVERLAQDEQFRVHFQALEDNVSGVLVRGKDSPGTIGVNATHHPNRQRFTIAHELGHGLLHPDQPTVFVDEYMVHFRDDASKTVPDPREMEANAFAAALLMPEKLLRRDLRERVLDAMDEVAVRSLARRYRVSQQALTIRLTNLGLMVGLGNTSRR